MRRRNKIQLNFELDSQAENESEIVKVKSNYVGVYIVHCKGTCRLYNVQHTLRAITHMAHQGKQLCRKWAQPQNFLQTIITMKFAFPFDMVLNKKVFGHCFSFKPRQLVANLKFNPKWFVQPEICYKKWEKSVYATQQKPLTSRIFPHWLLWPRLISVFRKIIATTTFFLLFFLLIFQRNDFKC